MKANSKILYPQVSEQKPLLMLRAKKKYTWENSKKDRDMEKGKLKKMVKSLRLNGTKEKWMKKPKRKKK